MEIAKRKLLEETYRLFMDAGFLKISPDILDDISDHHIMGFGTILDEKIFNVSGLKELLERQKQQSEGVSMQWDVTPVYRHLSADENTAIYADDLVLHITAGSDKLDMYLRFSVVLEYKNGKWVVVHWHGSKPEDVESEKDTRGIENWKQKAWALEKLVEERTADLVIKNRELEIEAALERVRARTMAMHKSEELQEVVNIVFDNLMKLEVFADTVTILIPKKDSKDFEVWIQNSDRNYSSFRLLPFLDQYVISRDLVMAGENKLSLFTKYYPKKDKDDFFSSLFDHPDSLKDIPEERKQYVLHGPSYSIAVSCNTYTGMFLGRYNDNAFSESDCDVIIRFAKVFEQTYTRFLDLQKAEAQAKEAQIEAALERVRARSLAMHKSGELSDLSLELVKQVQALGVKTWFCAFNIYDDDPQGSLEWGSNGEGTFPKYRTPREGVFLRYYEAGQRGETLLINKIGEDESPAHYEYLCSLPGVGDQLLKMKAAGIPFPPAQIDHVAFFRYGYLLFISYEPVPESHDIFKRFARVFEQSYTRFIDLKNAEAQTREGQINLAVERVRARALAMFKSEEILEVVYKMKEELQGLNIPHVSAATIHLKEKDGRCRIWDINSAEAESGSLYFPLDVKYTLEETDPDFFMRRIWENTSDYYIVVQDQNDFKRTIQWLRVAGLHNQADETEAFIAATHLEKLYHPTVQLANGRMCIDTMEPPVAEIESILHKMAAAFNLAYRRFEDLQNAEAQAREAQIQLGLERVRAKTMAMQKQQDLFAVVDAFGEQLVVLGLKVDYVCFMYGVIEKERDWNLWGSVPGLANSAQNNFIPYRKIPYFIRTDENIDASQRTGNPIQVKSFSKEEKDEFLDHYFSVAQPLPDDFKQILFDAPGSIIADAFLGEVTVSIVKYEVEPYSKEQLDIFRRFSIEFRQAYIRFIDLQKAETQAREALVERSLERIRGQVTSMQLSSDLFDIVVGMRREFIALGHEADFFWHMRWAPENYELSMTSEDGSRLGMVINVPRFVHEQIPRLYEWEKSNSPVFVLALNADEAWDYVDKMNTYGSFEQIDPHAPTEEDIRHIGGLTFIIARTTHGEVGFSLAGEVHEPPKESLDTLVRFAGVFDLAYKRFEDLKEAERRNRETEIELALERVRSRTMAMQHSNELSETAAEMFVQMERLGLHPWSCGFNIIDQREKTISQWVSSGDGRILPPFESPADQDVFVRFTEAFQQGETLYTEEMGGEALEDHYRYLTTIPAIRKIAEELKAANIQFPTFQVFNLAFFRYGYLMFITYEQVSAFHAVFQRFAKVFEQTYTRYLDLQRAEEQTREAQIEAALERVRAASMAMQSSADLSTVAFLLFEEFKGLHQASAAELSRAFVVTVNEPAEMFTFFITTTEGAYLPASFPLPFTEPTNGTPLFDCWRRKDAALINVLTGNVYKIWLDYLDTINLYVSPEIKAMTKRVNNYVRFSKGFLGITSLEPLSEEGLSVLKRFAGVFDQTYTRFLDLQQAEENTREAVRRASIERVRGEIASMRSPEDLQRITPLVWNELTTLGVPFFRCGVFIIKEQEQLVHAYLSTPDGSSLAVLHLPFEGEGTTHNTVEHWRRQTVYTEHWDKEQFKAWTQSMVEQGQIAAEQDYRAGQAPPESLYLQFIPFTQGMLYIGSANPLNEGQIELAHALANAFAVAYARYEDFIKLETAKQQIERTLVDLKQTQAQLVQSEKMASLGELTAGIAHEIQNPLNFVNNFSEVSKELLSELSIEVDSGNYDEVKAIVADVQQNLEKIHHHGERASSIVKGMLQHSRTTTGQKEPADINALIDEYLRLAYHGLKAKDKTFNATYITDFDPDLPPVQIIPQDMGRVLLNLINNAFYAVHEKRKTAKEGYKPEVIVSSKEKGGCVVLSVSDNGNGIPEAIREKIFQPFFTTKPTGEGTGLGLSLSYDIVKAHGGELKVEAWPEKRTVFTVRLPIK